MKIWFVGVPGGGSPGICKREIQLNTFWNSRLWSYYHLIESNGKMKTDEKKIDLFLDSGAFSAWTLKKEINIQEYIDFIKTHKEVINIYANLDVIGIGGKLPNKLTAEKTLENQKIMEAAGLNPMPCFHYGEPFSFLDYYCKNYEYLAIGVAGNSGTKLMNWLDECFSNHICNTSGIPKIKVHGFAVTGVPLMLRYPWYSVDSTSWVVTGRMGAIMTPKIKADGSWTYDERSWKIAVSSRSPGIKDDPGHINNLSPIKKQMFLDYIHAKGYILGESRFEKTDQKHELKENERWIEKKPKNKLEKRLLEIIEEPGISNKYQLRDEMNIIYFQDLEKSIQKWPWAFKVKNQIQRLEL